MFYLNYVRHFHSELCVNISRSFLKLRWIHSKSIIKKSKSSLNATRWATVIHLHSLILVGTSRKDSIRCVQKIWRLSISQSKLCKKIWIYREQDAVRSFTELSMQQLSLNYPVWTDSFRPRTNLRNLCLNHKPKQMNRLSWFNPSSQTNQFFSIFKSKSN